MKPKYKNDCFQFCFYQVEEDTSHSMKMLLEVDVVKSKMKAASDALQVR